MSRIAWFWCIFFYLIGLLLLPVQAADTGPSIPISQREAYYHKLQWSEACESDFRDAHPDVQDAGIDRYTLSDGSQLFFVECGSGAYQSAYDVIHYQPTAASLPTKRLVFPEANSEFVGLYGFDPKTLALTLFSKDRGIGDCGSDYVWRFQLVKRTFRLLSLRRLDCTTAEQRFEKKCHAHPDQCDTDELRDPAHWPRVK